MQNSPHARYGRVILSEAEMMALRDMLTICKRKGLGYVEFSMKDAQSAATKFNNALAELRGTSAAAASG